MITWINSDKQNHYKCSFKKIKIMSVSNSQRIKLYKIVSRKTKKGKWQFGKKLRCREIQKKINYDQW